MNAMHWTNPMHVYICYCIVTASIRFINFILLSRSICLNAFPFAICEILFWFEFVLLSNLKHFELKIIY